MSYNLKMKLSKKKGFLIDKISEDSFFENLLLGLTSLLKKSPFVTQIKLQRISPATVQELCNWEFTNDFALPEDLRNFFLSTNGFLFTYTFQYDKSEHTDTNHVIGCIEINPLSKLEKLVSADTMYLNEAGMKILAPNSKIHVLANLEENHKIVLAQFNPFQPPTIWLYYKMKFFYFLCENIVTYFRMALAYVGLPGWQLLVLNATVPEWTIDMIQILAPGIFHNRQTIEKKIELNKIDANIFNDQKYVSNNHHEERRHAQGSPKKKSSKNKTKK